MKTTTFVNFRRILAFLLLSLCLFAFAACDGEQTPPPPASSSSSSSSSLPDDTPPTCEHTLTPTADGCYCTKCEETFDHELTDGVCTECGYEEDKSVNLSKLQNPFITKYYHNAKAAISLTYDDGQIETGYGANELLGKYGLRGTIFFILDYGKNPRMSNQTAWNKWIADWNVLLAEGVLDIGNHSYHHYGQKLYAGNGTNAQGENYETEIRDAHTLLTECFPTQRIITFATPGYGFCEATRQALLQYGYRVNRGAGHGGLNNPYSSSFNPLKVNSVQLDKGANASEANGRVDTALANGSWYVETYHYIATKDGRPAAGYADNWAVNTGTVSREFCEDHYAYIGEKVASGALWCGSFNDVAAYVMERRYASVAYTASTETTITLSLTCEELRDVAGYDHALTVKVEVPSDWSSVSVSQNGGDATAYTAVTESGKSFIYLDAIPNGGDIVLTNVTE